VSSEAGANQITLAAIAGPHSGKHFAVNKFPFIIGRQFGSCVFLFSDSCVSQNHCEVNYIDDQLVIRDMDSTNGTFVNGRPAPKDYRPLSLKSTISVGKTLLFVHAGAPDKNDLDENAISNLLTSGSIIVNSGQSTVRTQKLESLFVVDVCNSTQLADLHGEEFLLSLMNAIAKILLYHGEKNSMLFKKCTGDGFFLTFDETSQALKVACGLLYNMKRNAEKSPETPKAGLRIAIHRGLVSIGDDHDRLGVACHMVFRMEGATSDEMVESPFEENHLIDEDRILLSKEAVDSLDRELIDCFEYLGKFRFKGFSDPAPISMVTEDPFALYKKIS